MGQVLSRNISAKSSSKYPQTRRDETVVDTYHGQKVSDPYRWLEDPDSEETAQFVNAQRKIFNEYFADCDPLCDQIKQKMTSLYNFERFSAPTPRKGKYLFSRNTGLQNQDVIYVSYSPDDKTGEVFIDPNQWSSDGTVALSALSSSFDATKLAFASSESGSDWNTVRFMTFDSSRTRLADKLEHVKFSCFNWLADGSGGFYNMYDAEKKADGTETTENTFCKTMFHRMGTDQCEDKTILHFPDEPGRIASVYATRDAQFLIATLRCGCKTENAVWIHRIKPEGGFEEANIEWIKLLPDSDAAAYMAVENKGSVFYFMTNCDGADRFKLISIDIDQPQKEHWKTIIPEDPSDILENCHCAHGNRLIVNRVNHVKNILSIHDLETGRKLVEHGEKEMGAVSIESIKTSIDEHEVFFSSSSFTSPRTVYKIDLEKSMDIEIYKQVKFDGLDVSNVQCEQVFYNSSESPDVKIPMYILHLKDSPRDGTNPLFLYGYGGFGVNLMPGFSVQRLIWICSFGGTLAIPNIRGGGEYGEQWHKDGQKHKKMNCFHDFIDAAEYLIEHKYTSKDRLVINGGSNGGLLVAACANLRPDLFRMCIPDVGVMDMLRFHKWTIGIAWVSDFGCSDDEEDFKCLIKYSPLHNISKNKPYPTVLCITADHDDRVVPAHTFKYMAELQYQLGSSELQKHPLMVFIEVRAGHGQGKPISKQIEIKSVMLAMIAKELGLKFEIAKPLKLEESGCHDGLTSLEFDSEVSTFNCRRYEELTFNIRLN